MFRLNIHINQYLMEENRTHLHMLTRLTGGRQVKRWPKYVRNPDVTQVVFATLSHYCWIGIVWNSSTEIEHTQSNPALKFKHWSCAGLFMLPSLKMLFFPTFTLILVECLWGKQCWPILGSGEIFCYFTPFFIFWLPSIIPSELYFQYVQCYFLGYLQVLGAGAARLWQRFTAQPSCKTSMYTCVSFPSLWQNTGENNLHGKSLFCSCLRALDSQSHFCGLTLRQNKLMEGLGWSKAA